MIDIHIPTSLEYNTANANLLATTIQNYSSIDEITQWNKKAMAEVKDLSSILKAIEEKQEIAIQVISQEQQEHKNKTLLSKIFAGRKEQKQWLAEQSRLDREKTQIENVIKQFQSTLDFMPDSHEKVKDLLEDCKLQKKELDNEIKATTAQKSSIRIKAKQQKANTNYGKYGKGDRKRIRINKKSALHTQGDLKTGIQSQIAKLDQIINWLERIK